MRIEFNGATIETTGTENLGGFSLTVGGQTMTLLPVTAGPTAKPLVYRMEFAGFPYGETREGKIPVIKAIREFLVLGLGEAKAISEGQTVYISGGVWDQSEFKARLDSITRNTYNVTPATTREAQEERVFRYI